MIAYGCTIFMPKHYFMLHIPKQLERFKFLVACWVHERKHRIITPRTHTQSLKEPLLKPCLPDAVYKHVRKWWLHCGNLASHRLNQLTCRTAGVHGRSIQVGDVVLYTGGGPNGGCTDTRVGEVFFHAMLRGELLVCLSHWPTKREATHWRKAVVSDEFAILPSACMLQAVIFTPAEVGKQSTVLVSAL